MLLRMFMTAMLMVVSVGQSSIALAQSAANQISRDDILRFAEVLQIGPLMDVIAQEGRANAEDLNQGLLGNEGGAAWDAAIARLYDPAVMADKIVGLLQVELAQDPQILAQSEAFFASAIGQRALFLEVEARRALLADGAEAAAEAGYYGMVAKKSPRVQALKRLVDANDLIESNVMTSLNSNLAFLKGMAAASGDASRNETELLSEVWAGEADVRKDTEIWMLPYLALAYEPMSDEEFESYIAFSNSPAGKKISAAIFRAFDAFAVESAAVLGEAVGAELVGQDI